MKPKLHPITIIQDTREQRPLDFSPFPSVSVEVAKLDYGDYAIKGYETSVAFERKSVSDLIGSIKDCAGRHSPRRKRFDYELDAFMRFYSVAYLVVEPDDMATIREAAAVKGHADFAPTRQLTAKEQIDLGLYRSAMRPDCVKGFLRFFWHSPKFKLIMAKSREDAAARVVDAARFHADDRRARSHRDAKPVEIVSPPWN